MDLPVKTMWISFLPRPRRCRARRWTINSYGRGEAVWSLFDGRFKNFFGVNHTNSWSWTLDPNPDSFTAPPAVAPPTTILGQRTQFDWRGEASVAPGTNSCFRPGRQDRVAVDKLHWRIQPFGTYVPTTTTAQTGDKAGWVELQSGVCRSVLRRVEYSLRRQRELRAAYDVARCTSVYRSMDGHEAQGDLWDGLQAPTLTELYVNNPSFMVVGNPNLLPETSKGYDVGFEQPFLHDRLAFRRDIFPQRHHKSHRGNDQSDHLRLDLCECRTGDDPGRRSLRGIRFDQSAGSCAPTTPIPRQETT